MAKKAAKGAGKIAGKQIRKQVRSLKGDVRSMKKGMAKEVTRATKSMASQTKDLKAEFSKLSDEMKSMKKTGAQPKRELSMYNLFVRKQIENGKTFEQAVKSWKSSRKMIEHPELANAKPKTRTKTITKTKVVVRKVPMYAHGPTPAAVSAETKESLGKVMRELNALKTEMSSMDREAKPMPKILKQVPSAFNSVAPSELPAEEVAVRLTRLYFEEIARLGFKRRLDFDAIINAYYYCLQRLGNKDKELEVMRKLVDKEENKLTHESKAQLFPEMHD
jgi:hypothetical protein